MSPSKLADLSQLSVAELRELRRAKSQSTGKMRLAPLQAMTRPEHIPLSFAQERLWFLDQLGLAETAYNLPAAIRMKGALDVAALTMSLEELVRRHESLRTRFELIDGKGVQRIDEPASFIVAIMDLSGLPEQVRTAEIERLMDEASTQTFDLATGPLFRARLIKRGPEDHSLFVIMHHIVSDGWSLSVMMHELSALYPAFALGQPSPLPEPEFQYGDFALWQRNWLQGDALERQLGYWRSALWGAPASIDLPTDRRRPKVASFRGAMTPFAVSRDVTDALNEVAKREGATLFMVLLAAFQTILSRWSGQDDIVIGSPIAGRTLRQTEGLVGFFVNTLALRINSAGNPTFADLIRRVRDFTLNAYAHQDLPLEKVVAELALERDLGRQPLFQTMLVLQNAPGAALHLGELELSMEEIEHRGAKFDLTLSIAETPGGLRGSLEYAVDLFDAATIDRFAGHLAAIIGQIATDPAIHVDDIQLVAPAEHRDLMVAGGVQTSDSHEGLCIHQLFAAQSARTPDAIAVEYEGGTLTYRELDRRANQLAHHLQALDVGPEIIIGLCVERSLEMVVGVLGILKAGGAYLPLDPSYPTERLTYMVENAQVPVLVTVSSLADRLPPRDGLALVYLDAAEASIEARPDTAPDIEIRSDALAYVIYTSGSTGRPKGALIEHRNVTRLFASAKLQIEFGSADVWTLYHSFSFDFSVWEIFGAILHGGRLVIVPFEISRSPEAFATFIGQHRVSVLNQTPTAFYGLLPHIDAAVADHLRYVIFGGEALDASRLTGWFSELREPAQLINMYGITETTVHVTVKPVSSDDVAHDSDSIGRPLADLTAYVLDPRGRLAPIGVFGELYVGGAGVARGYLGEPELTAARFPTVSIDGKSIRLYRTGDRARWIASGELEYGGRLDAQVKVRGFRIEPGEVERALRDCRGIADAIVTTEPDGQSAARLIAYFTADASPQALTASDIHTQLSARLPAHMIPSDFRKIGRITLTSNGKLDRSCTDGAIALHHQAERVSPGSPLEEAILAVFEDVLETSGLSVIDNFFAVGGDSIRMVQLVHRLNSAGQTVAIGDVFQNQSVRGLASVLARRSPLATSPDPRVPLQLIDLALTAISVTPPLDAVDLYPITEMQRLMVERSVEMGLGVYRPQHLLTVIDPDFSIERFAAVFNELASREAPLRTRFATHSSGTLLQYVKREDPISIDLHDVSGLTDAARDTLIEECLKSNVSTPFPIDADRPLMKFDAFQASAGISRLAITSHHAVEDGWGFIEFMRELERTYYRPASESGDRLPCKPNGMKEHVALQLEAQQNDTAAREWWQSQLDRPPMLVGHSIDAGLDEVAQTILVSAAELKRMGAKAAGHGISLKSLFLAACMKAAGEALDREEAIFDVVTNGRSPRLTDPFKSFGLFWSFLPVAGTVKTLLEGEGLNRLQAILARGEELNLFPVGILVREKGLRDMTCAAFNYVNFHNANPRLGMPKLVNFLSGRDRFHHSLKFTVSIAPDFGSAQIVIEMRLSMGKADLANRLMRRTRAALALLH